MRAWQKKNRKKIRLYNNQWRLSNPEKVKAQKRRSAQKYKTRRLMLYKSRSPEQIAEDNRKAMERHHRLYPNRSPEQVERDRERNRLKYQKIVEATQLARLGRIIEKLKSKPVSWRLIVPLMLLDPSLTNARLQQLVGEEGRLDTRQMTRVRAQLRDWLKKSQPRRRGRPGKTAGT